MNYRTFTLSHLSLFFCLCGWVCAGSAIGAQSDDDGQVAAAPGTTITVGGEAGDEAESLFAADTAEDESSELPAGQTVEVGKGGQIELHVENQEVTKILKLLSLQAHRNIIASRNVAGTVSADLYGVDFYEALDAVLHANGFGYRERANFVYVYTSEEIAKMVEDEARLVTHIIRLNYITATYAKTFADPLLSERGAIIVNTELASSMEPTLEDNGKNEFAYPDTLIIRDQQEHVDEIIRIIDELDKRPKQVQIEATIMRVRLTEDNAFGTDLSVVLDNNMGLFTDPLNVVDQTLTGTVGTYALSGPTNTMQSTVGNVAKGDAGFKVGVVTRNVSVFIRALDRVSDATIIARPKLLVLNRHRAKLLVGDKLGYLSSTATETSTTQTVEFLEVGTQLTVRPFAGDDGFIRLEIQPSISDGETVAAGNVIIPNESSNELITNVMVRSGQTVVLGGLFKEDTIISKDQIPGLGQMPVVGGAFQGHDDHVVRSEVIFLITPTVVKDTALYAGGEEASIGVTETGIGAKTGLLPWSRSKQAAAHMRDAMKYHRQGNTDKALLYVKMVLSLEPTHEDALKLKRQLVQQAQYEPQDSILKHSIDAIVAEQQEVNEVAEQADQQTAKPVAAPEAPAPAEPMTPVAADTSPAPAEAETQQVEAAPEPEPESTAKVDPEPATEPEPDAPAEAPDVAAIEPEPEADLKVEVQPPVDPDKLSAKLLEAMSRWLPGGSPTATTAAVDETAGDN